MNITFKIWSTDTVRLYIYLDVTAPSNVYTQTIDQYKYAIWMLLNNAGIDNDAYTIARPDMSKFILMFNDIEAYTYAKLFL